MFSITVVHSALINASCDYKYQLRQFTRIVINVYLLAVIRLENAK